MKVQVRVFLIADDITAGEAIIDGYNKVELQATIRGKEMTLLEAKDMMNKMLDKVLEEGK